MFDISQALRLHQGRQLLAAQAAYRRILAEDPAQGDALHLLGALSAEMGRAQMGMTLIKRAVAARWRADYYINLCTIFRAHGGAGNARAIHRVDVALRPDYLESYFSLAAALRAGDQVEAAEAAWRHALALKPDQPETHYNLGRVLDRQGRLEAAEAAFRKAIALRPAFPEAHFGLGMALHHRDRPLEALAALGRREEALAVPGASAATSEHAEALFAIGRRLFEDGSEEQAIAVYRRFAGLTQERARYPGHAPRAVAVRPAATVCRERGWPYHTIAPAGPLRVTADDGGADGADGGETVHAYDLPEIFLAFAEDAVLVPHLHAPLVPGEALLVDGFNTNSRGSLPLLPHIVWHGGVERMLLDMAEPETRIEEEAILLGGGPNWSHGVLDWLSKLVALERHPELDGLPVLIDAATPRPILDLAEMLGIDRARLRSLASGAVVAGRRLWLPSLTHDYQFTSPLHLDFLRARLAGPLAQERAGRRRLFLSRRKAGYRALVNEAEVLAALARFGVEAVVPEDHSMAEQIRLFASAELIVGPLGGGSAAVVFAAAGTGYVELTHDKMILSQYAILCGLLGQRFRRVVGATGGRRGVYTFDQDFSVPPDAVVAAVQGLLDTGPGWLDLPSPQAPSPQAPGLQG